MQKQFADVDLNNTVPHTRDPLHAQSFLVRCLPFLCDNLSCDNPKSIARKNSFTKNTIWSPDSSFFRWKLKLVHINCFKYKSLRYLDYLVCIQNNSFILNLNHLPMEVRIRYIFCPVSHSNIALFQWIPLSLRHRGVGNYTISHDVLTLWFLCNKHLFLYIMELDMSSFDSSVIDL